jgi:hypothetical protein
VALARLGQSAIRPNAGLRMHAPEQALGTGLHDGIRFGGEKLLFPAEARAEIRMSGIGPQKVAPVAFSTARLTATRANWTL